MADEDKPLSEGTVDDLDADIARSVDPAQLILNGTDTGPDPEGRGEYLSQLNEAEITRLQQQNSLRGKFFWVASALAFLIVASSVVGVGYYVLKAGAEADPLVLITWMTAVIVEILGILKIISMYLFPESKGDSPSSTDG